MPQFFAWRTYIERDDVNGTTYVQCVDRWSHQVRSMQLIVSTIRADRYYTTIRAFRSRDALLAQCLQDLLHFCAILASMLCYCGASTMTKRCA